MTWQPSNLGNISEFDDAVILFYSNNDVANCNHEKLAKLQQPVARISGHDSSTVAKKYDF